MAITAAVMSFISSDAASTVLPLRFASNLFGNDVSSEPGKSTQMGGKGSLKVGGDNSSVISAIENLGRTIASRPIIVSVDGKKLIEATTGAQPNTVGDETGKNSYQMA